MPNIVKNTTMISFLDLLAPHSCRGYGRIGKPLCDCCKNYIISQHQNICPICHTSNSDGKCQKCSALPPIFIAGKKSSLLGDLIHDYKYYSVRALSRPLAEILHQILPPTNTDSIIVPLPTISRHLRERGFDHTKSIAKHLTHLHRSQTKSLLIRNQNTVQVGSSRATRLAQASSAYAIAKNIKINPSTTYILLDDIWTTGASLQSAYSLLKKAGAQKILIAVLALSE